MQQKTGKDWENPSCEWHQVDARWTSGPVVEISLSSISLSFSRLRLSASPLDETLDTAADNSARPCLKLLVVCPTHPISLRWWILPGLPHFLPLFHFHVLPTQASVQMPSACIYEWRKWCHKQSHSSWVCGLVSSTCETWSCEKAIGSCSCQRKMLLFLHKTTK